MGYRMALCGRICLPKKIPESQKSGGAEMCAKIMNRIERINNEDEKDVMTYRNIKLMQWENIIAKMGFGR